MNWVYRNMRGIIALDDLELVDMTVNDGGRKLIQRATKSKIRFKKAT